MIETVSREKVVMDSFTSAHIMKEGSEPYTNHDRLFKRLLESYFEEFIEAFFPEFYEEMDFTSISFLSEEYFSSMFDEDKQVLDIVIQVKWRDTDSLIVVHIEPQSYVQYDFHQRMFYYFSTLYKQLKMPVLPIAIFSYEQDWETNDVIIEFKDTRILHFTYLSVHLRKQNWRHFLKKDNPVAAALLSKMGYSKKEKVKVKREFLQMILRMKLDREKTDFLMSFFDTYIQMSEEEEEQLMEEIRKTDDGDEIFELTNSYVLRGRREGREEGQQEGRISIIRDLLNSGMSADEIKERLAVSEEELMMAREE